MLVYKSLKDNIEFEKKCSDLHNSLQEEIRLNGVLLAKKKNRICQINLTV